MREVDALGGLMGRCADAAGIRSAQPLEGPAVRGPQRGDRDLYGGAGGGAELPNLRVVERAVDDLLFDADGVVAGVVTTSATGPGRGRRLVRRVDDGRR